MTETSDNVEPIKNFLTGSCLRGRPNRLGTQTGKLNGKTAGGRREQETKVYAASDVPGLGPKVGAVVSSVDFVIACMTCDKEDNEHLLSPSSTLAGPFLPFDFHNNCKQFTGITPTQRLSSWLPHSLHT